MPTRKPKKIIIIIIDGLLEAIANNPEQTAQSPFPDSDPGSRQSTAPETGKLKKTMRVYSANNARAGEGSAARRRPSNQNGAFQRRPTDPQLEASRSEILCGALQSMGLFTQLCFVHPEKYEDLFGGALRAMGPFTQLNPHLSEKIEEGDIVIVHHEEDDGGAIALANDDDEWEFEMVEKIP
jgi:hypothetical protein